MPRDALLREAAQYLREAIAHEHSSREVCGGRAPPAMEHAFRENLAHVLGELGEEEAAAEEAELARAVAPRQGAPAAAASPTLPPVAVT